MALTVTGGRPSVDESMVRDFELRAGLVLPAGYRAFLIQHNGGRPLPKRFATRDGKVESMVAWFFTVDGEDDGSLWSDFEGFTLAGQVPANILPIARDPADDRIVLSVAGRDCGHVYYWSWSEEPDPASCSYRHLRLISTSFTEFLGLLR